MPKAFLVRSGFYSDETRADNPAHGFPGGCFLESRNGFTPQPYNQPIGRSHRRESHTRNVTQSVPPCHAPCHHSNPCPYTMLHSTLDSGACPLQPMTSPTGMPPPANYLSPTYLPQASLAARDTGRLEPYFHFHDQGLPWFDRVGLAHAHLSDDRSRFVYSLSHEHPRVASVYPDFQQYFDRRGKLETVQSDVYPESATSPASFKASDGESEMLSSTKNENPLHFQPMKIPPPNQIQNQRSRDDKEPNKLKTDKRDSMPHSSPLENKVIKTEPRDDDSAAAPIEPVECGASERGPEPRDDGPAATPIDAVECGAAEREPELRDNGPAVAPIDTVEYNIQMKPQDRPAVAPVDAVGYLPSQFLTSLSGGSKNEFGYGATEMSSSYAPSLYGPHLNKLLMSGNRSMRTTVEANIVSPLTAFHETNPPVSEELNQAQSASFEGLIRPRVSHTDYLTEGRHFWHEGFEKTGSLAANDPVAAIIKITEALRGKPPISPGNGEGEYPDVYTGRNSNGFSGIRDTNGLISAVPTSSGIQTKGTLMMNASSSWRFQPRYTTPGCPITSVQNVPGSLEYRKPEAFPVIPGKSTQAGCFPITRENNPGVLPVARIIPEVKAPHTLNAPFPRPLGISYAGSASKYPATDASGGLAVSTKLLGIRYSGPASKYPSTKANDAFNASASSPQGVSYSGSASNYLAVERNGALKVSAKPQGIGFLGPSSNYLSVERNGAPYASSSRPQSIGCSKPQGIGYAGAASKYPSAAASGAPTGSKHVCDQCGRSFTRSSTLVTHKRIHTGDKPFVCETCGRAFRQPGNLSRHRLTHTTSKPYVCTHCDKAFNRASNLHTHMRTHTDYKPYACDFCDKQFHQKVDMKIHRYIHTGEKPHKCDKCGRGFKQLTHLTYHLRTHSDVRLYTCKYCGKGFNQKGNLQAHTYRHTGERPFTCDICGKGFTLASTRNTHKRTHSKEKPFKCNYCEKAFYQKNALKTHYISSHPYTGGVLLL